MPVMQLTTLGLSVVKDTGLGPLLAPCAMLNHNTEHA